LLLFGTGWMNEVKNKTLCIYKVDLFDYGPEIMLSVTIKENFSWLVSFRKQHVNRESSSILRNMPSEMDSGMLSKIK